MKNTVKNTQIANLYTKFAQRAINRLNHFYAYEDREDAVAEAFRIVLEKEWPKETRIPQTDEEWYAKILSCAKGRLSNAISKARNRAKYTRRLAEEPKLTPSYCYDPYITLEMRKRQLSLKRMLEILFEAQKISNRDRNIFLRLLDGEEVDAIVNDNHNLTANNIYQIKFRIYKKLKNHGRKYLAQAAREVEML